MNPLLWAAVGGGVVWLLRNPALANITGGLGLGAALGIGGVVGPGVAPGQVSKYPRWEELPQNVRYIIALAFAGGDDTLAGQLWNNTHPEGRAWHEDEKAPKLARAARELKEAGRDPVTGVPLPKKKNSLFSQITGSVSQLVSVGTGVAGLV